jgi:hypothetical protein
LKSNKVPFEHLYADLIVIDTELFVNYFRHMNLFSPSFCSFYTLRIGIRIRIPNMDPDPDTNRMQIRFRNTAFQYANRYLLESTVHKLFTNNYAKYGKHTVITKFLTQLCLTSRQAALPLLVLYCVISKHAAV